MELKCVICNKKIEFKDARGLSKFTNHLKQHNISGKEYYDKYLKKEKEDKCIVCGNTTKFISILRGYRTCCCVTCNYEYARSSITNDSKERSIRNMRKTKLEKYNDPNYSNPEKSKQTKLEKYNDPNYSNPEKTKQTKLEKYGDPYYSNSEKAKHTCLKKYGQEHFTNRKKCRETFKEKYGTECIFTLDKVKEKIAKTKLEKYGDAYFTNREKYINTCKEKYNANSIFAVPGIQEKIKETCLKKYGVEYSWQAEQTKEKIKETCLKKYGVEYPMQNHDIRISTQHKYEYNDKKFDSAWELAYYIWLKDHKIDFEYQPDALFTYNYLGNIHYYHPDFKVNNEYIELKGLHFFEDKNPNNKMINPYDRTQDDLYEAKRQCMINHNVKIITDCSEYLDYVNNKYTADFLPLFKKDLPFPYLNGDLHDKSDMGLIHHFHKSIYEATRKYKLSPIEAWKDKNIIENIALNRLKYVGRCKPSDILQGFNVTRIANKVSLFKPMLAESLIRKYLNDSEIIFDPFSGFSGRMLGAFNCGKRYFGYDINEEHVNESKQIIDYKRISNTCTIEVDDLLKTNKKDYTNLKNTALFTCPPYGGKEHWNKNNDEVEMSCDEWIDLCIEKYKVNKYLFVVDKTEKYKNNIVETIENKSHFGTNYEYVILI